MVKKAPLNVFTVGTNVGALTRSDIQDDTVLFGYGPGTAAADAVSLTMPVRTDQYDSMAGLLPIFEMNLPEGALRERLRSLFAKVIPEFDDLDLLGIVGTSQIGRLRYSHGREISEEVPGENLEEILTYRGGEDLFAHLMTRYARFSGVSGMQPKVLIRDSGFAGKVAHLGATHLVKSFDRREYPELAANEYLCTLGARAAGIRTANVRLSGNRQLLLVDRFDLIDGKYLGVEDFCVLNARRAHGRYDGSYERIAQRIREFVSPESLPQALEQYVLQVVYACAIGNGDAHLKNFSVLYADAQAMVELSPAYDMLCTVLYSPRDTLALELGGDKAFPDRARLVHFIRAVTGKSARAAQTVLRQVGAGVREAIRLAHEFGREHTDAGHFVQRLTAALTHGLTGLGEHG